MSEASTRDSSAGSVLAWSSALAAFGSVQGAIYLKAYWGRFGLDPFQFHDVSALALVGLTAVGATLAFIGAGALLGGYLSSRIEPWAKASPRAGALAAALLSLTIFFIAIRVDFGWQLVCGMSLTWSLIWLAQRAPALPDWVKSAQALPYIALAVAYVPLGSHYLGTRRAEAVKVSTSRAEVGNLSSMSRPKGDHRFAGSLGGSYVLYSPSDHSVLVIRADEARGLALYGGDPKSDAASPEPDPRARDGN